MIASIVEATRTATAPIVSSTFNYPLFFEILQSGLVPICRGKRDGTVAISILPLAIAVGSIAIKVDDRQL